MTTEMDLTEFRSQMTQVIDTLDTTGPVRLMKYGDVVAELRSCSRKARKSEAERWVSTITRLTEAQLDWVFAAGFSLDDAEELIGRRDTIAGQGGSITTEYYGPTFSDETDPVTINDVLTYWYFDGDVPEKDGHAWMEALVDLQRMARERGMSNRLPDQTRDDESNAIHLIRLATESGYTPGTLRKFAEQQMNQGIQLADLDNLMGEEAIPADLLTRPGFHDYDFSALVSQGLPHAEAVTAYRRNLDIKAAIEFAELGLHTADDIEEVIKSGIRPDMAKRAAWSGLTPSQWRTQLLEIKKYNYTADGILPIGMLIEAAREGLSLVRWDSSSLPVPGTKGTRHRGAVSRTDRAYMYPWKHIVPERVLDLARAGVSVTLTSEYAQLMRHCYTKNGYTFVEDLIAAHRHGLTGDLAKAMRKSDSDAKDFFPTPSELVSILDEGLTPAHAEYLLYKYEDANRWLTELRAWKALKPVITERVTEMQATPVWDTLRAYAEARAKERNLQRRKGSRTVLDEAADLIDTPQEMLGVHLLNLLFSAQWTLTDTKGYYWEPLSNFRAEHGKHALLVKEAWTDFGSDYRQAREAAAQQD
jgi:hypothetical protein